MTLRAIEKSTRWGREINPLRRLPKRSSGRLKKK
jgi:hypothetical protein